MALLTLAAPAAAATPELVVTTVGAPAADGSLIRVTILNDTDTAITFAAPDQLTASVVAGSTATSVGLVRAPTAPATVRIAPGGFARVDYTARLPVAAGVLTLAGSAGGFAFGGTAVAPPSPARAPAAAPVVVEETLASPTADTGNAYLANLSAYEPIYAVYGPGTNTDGLIQVSFKYQLFGRGGAPAADRRWFDGITFAYTQRMYWDLGAPSVPFRDIDFQPELFYLVPARPLAGDVLIGGHAGARHISNGRDGAASRSVNLVYFNPTVTVPVGDWSLRVGPQAWAYIGDLGDNPDIAHYRGNTGLFAEIGRDNGLRLSATGRLNVASGRGALDVEASYPLDRLIGSAIKLYVFGQGFVGYGENLLDYNHYATRLRVGLGFVR